MRGRQREVINNTYKRASSKDRLSAEDRQDGLGGNSIGKGSGNPPWIRSLPHGIVAALSSFLFGYHLGYKILIMYIISVMLSRNILRRPVNIKTHNLSEISCNHGN